jgi:hypothetical protein
MNGFSNASKVVLFEYFELDEDTDVLKRHTLNICSTWNTIIDVCFSQALINKMINWFA